MGKLVLLLEGEGSLPDHLLPVSKVGEEHEEAKKDNPFKGFHVGERSRTLLAETE